ncbi:MAG: D-glycero-beta-D-manno-heptose 1,7-bisphosphate 7-phosphatase [Cocleimonas sp.]|nr:D-glycero-beta-D-manno-heptose 1,7-bisphosphate 7-phosphatase [Cocleimonas sp.]
MTTILPSKLIILDRDGVINEDSEAYIKSSEEWIPIPNSLVAIARLNQADYPVAIATNQSGVGRGYYNEATLQSMHIKMHHLLKVVGGTIDHIEYCPHLPTDNCQCRKPKAGMLKKIMKQFAVNTDDTLMIGDSLSDYYASQQANIGFVLVKTGKGERTLASGELPDEVPCYNNLAGVVDDILGNDK